MQPAHFLEETKAAHNFGSKSNTIKQIYYVLSSQHLVVKLLPKLNITP